MDESIVRNFRPQVGTLKLSEAIRAGAKLRPQGFGATFKDGKSCAVGAAYEAVTGLTSWPQHEEVYSFLSRHFGVPYSLLRRDVCEKNDSRETREQIADWLEAQGN